MKIRWLRGAVLFVASAIMSFNFTNCSGISFGSNPSTSYASGGVVGNPLTAHSAAAVLSAICSVLSRCNSQLTSAKCESSVDATSGIGVNLGLPAGAYEPYSSIETAEASGAIKSNVTDANACVAAIDQLSCGSSAVSGAYNPSLANPFAAVANMIPTQACGSVFANTYEYIYFGDQNNSSLPGYSINVSSGVLTPVANSPAMYGSTLSLGKTSANTQLLLAKGHGAGSAYRIDATTGILNAVNGAGFINGYGPLAAVFSPSGNYVYSIGSSEGNGLIAFVNPTTGDFSTPVATTSFPSPINSAWDVINSPDGNYVYFIDPFNNAIEGYSTADGALTAVGRTLLPTPNAGAYTQFSNGVYVDASANVIYLVFGGATGSDNNWIMPYKMNSDGSLSSGIPLNLGTNPSVGASGAMAGDSTGKYLFVAVPQGSSGNLGINTYTIGANGTLTYSSGPALAGQNFVGLQINLENSLIYGNSSQLVTASINMTTGVLTPVSSVADPCGNQGPMSVDPNEKFVYTVNYTVVPNVVCGFTVSASGAIGPISGQSYPLAVPGSGSLISSATVRLTQ